MPKGLDPVDLVRALNESSDLGPFERKHDTRGGRKTDLPTIAGDNCWCGRDKGHDWLGRDDGAPHPRYPE